MIGNLDYIIDEVAKKRGKDRRIVEVVAKEFFKSWKYEMSNSEALSFHMRKLGHWGGMNSKLRNAAREYIRKLRKIREKIASGKVPEEKMDSYKNIEAVYKDRLTKTWKQIDAIRYVFINNKKVTKAKKLRRELKYGNTSGVR